MQKKKKKIPRKKKIIIIRIKKNSGGVKPQWTELPEKGLPLCTWTIKQESDGKPCARCQAEVWTALSVESRVSSCLKTHILGWYWIYSPEIFKVWHSGRLETTSFVWLAQLWVKQHPDNLSLISIWFLSLSLFFVSTSKARKIEHW